MLLEWRAGVQHVLPNALSRLPHSLESQANVDDSFPDNFTLGAPSDVLGPKGSTLDGVRLAKVDAENVAGADGDDSPSDPRQNRR